ncbi:hypothetical protein FALCPG4_015161 [Fusarium falciforme]
MPYLTWDQWWAADQPGFPGSSEAAGGIPYDQHEPHLEDFIPNCTSASSNELTGSIFAQGYPTPPQTSESISSKDSPSNSERRRDSSSTQSDKRKRKRNTTDRAPTKSSKRCSSKKREPKTAAGESGGNSKRGSINKAATTNLSSPEYENDDYTRKVQEKNRIASNKLRAKKREDERRLESEEEDMERINRDLSTCVTDLTLQVHDLKMKLLQHTDCDCALIQEYISNEAHRYIQDLRGERQPHQPR